VGVKGAREREAANACVRVCERERVDGWVCLISRILTQASCNTCCNERPSAPIARVPEREGEEETGEERVCVRVRDGEQQCETVRNMYTYKNIYEYTNTCINLYAWMNLYVYIYIYTYV